jgi:TctA family transporter
MLAGIYYGAQYGGSTTAILINLPGESSAAVTAIDGHEMTKQGRAGKALATAALGSFFAGTVATVFVALLATPISDLALNFGPPEFFSLIVLGLIASITLASGSTLKALAMIVLGLRWAPSARTSPRAPALHLRHPGAVRGLEFVSLAVGLFGIAEIVAISRRHDPRRHGQEGRGPLAQQGRLPPHPDAGAARHAPGLGARRPARRGHVLASFVSYSVEKRSSKHPEEFGKGAIEGSRPESANNAAAQTAFIPLLTLGLPANSIMALLVGALLIQGIVPGPDVINDEPELFWGLIVSFWIGNLFLVLLNLPLIGLWVKMLTIPYRWLFPAIIAFAAIGTYSLSLNAFDVYAIAFFAILGYVLVKLGCEPAPLLLGSSWGRCSSGTCGGR